MKRLNDYFLSTSRRREIKHRISLCGKLEAMIGNYFLSGAGVPDYDIQVLYYDSTVGFYDAIPLVKENIVAYIFEQENVAFVKEDMLTKFKNDTEEYALVCISVNSFEADEFYIDREMPIPLLLKNIIWIDDDFMNDENIEFDYEAFDIIDSGEKYINPKHFSVVNLVDALLENVNFQAVHEFANSRKEELPCTM